MTDRGHPPSWPVTTIGEIAEVKTGRTPSREDASNFEVDIPWVKTGEVADCIISQTEEHLSEAGRKAWGCELFPVGTILIALYGQGQTRGRTARLGVPATTNQACAAVLPTQSVDQDFLWWWLRGSYLSLRQMGRGGNQLNLNLSMIREFPVPLPPLPEQRRIADVLDRAEALRAKRRAALALLDTLTQSIFLDMFGGPIKNPKKMKIHEIGDILHIKSGEFLPSSQMSTNGQYPVFGGNGISGYHNSYLFEEPTIVIGRVGAYCGCVHKTPPYSWVTDNALYVKAICPDFEIDYLYSSLLYADLHQYSNQSGQPLISAGRIRPVKILAPPLSLQKDFARRIAAVEQLRSAQRASLAKLDELFASLQHRAFRGEL